MQYSLRALPRKGHPIPLMAFCALFGACAAPAPPPECASAQVQSALIAVVREQFLWTVLADSVVPVDADRKRGFARAATISVEAPRQVDRYEATGKLQCTARVVFEASRLDGGLNKRADGDLAYGVMRGEQGNFLVDVRFPDVTALSKRIARQFKPTVI